MIITNVEINNFRCYYGKNNISFDPTESKITLIWGDSGYGKSSFLQFFRWMFYSDPDFGVNDDKPLFNIAAYNECKFGETVTVSGQIDFEHLGSSYRLSRVENWSTALKYSNSTLQRRIYKLYVKKSDGGYHEFEGEVADQINSILPKGLSKYFLLDGERARDIVLDSNELKKAIHTLFGLDAYTEAIKHIGNKSSGKTVLGHYHNLMASSVTHVSVGNMSLSELQETIQDLYEEIETMKAERKKIMEIIDVKNARRDEIFKTLGAVASKSNIEYLIKANTQQIKQNEAKIVSIQHSIGDLFYRNYPYLFLAQLASRSSTVLRQKNKEFASSYTNIFENLKKGLLKEILDKNICVCGRELDDETIARINNIIDAMPPNSYTYQFGQFIASAKAQIRSADRNVMNYESLLAQIAALEKENAKLEDLNREKLDELKRLDDAKELVAEIEKIKVEIDELSRQKAGYEGKIAKKKQVYDISSKQLATALKNAKVSTQFQSKIDFFDKVLALLKEEKVQRERVVRDTLNACVKEVFKKLTTQTELDVDQIQFVNDDFSLRTTYLTGGQLAVDVYSYVIGIIKALQECKMDTNENPIIIDAPFAFTGNAQSEHIFRTLPTVSKQTILLTLDLNKIKNLLSDTSIFDFYVIKTSKSQDKATIERGDVNGFKF